MCDDLAAIGMPVPDQKKSWWLLNGLGKEYEVFTSTLLRPPVLLYSDIVTLLESYTERHKLDAQPTPQMAFYGQRNNKNKRNNGGQGSFNSKGRGFVQGAQSTLKNSSHPTRNLPANSPIIAAKNTKDEAIICQICNKRNHTALKCFN